MSRARRVRRCGGPVRESHGGRCHAGERAQGEAGSGGGQAQVGSGLRTPPFLRHKPVRLQHSPLRTAYPQICLSQYGSPWPGRGAAGGWGIRTGNRTHHTRREPRLFFFLSLLLPLSPALSLSLAACMHSFTSSCRSYRFSLSFSACMQLVDLTRALSLPGSHGLPRREALGHPAPQGDGGG